MNAQHTPTPWALVQPDEPYDSFAIVSAPRAGLTIARIWQDDAPVHDFNMMQKANAAFIVRACNAHDELVAALSAFRRVGFGNSMDANVFAECMNAARAALAKAGAT